MKSEGVSLAIAVGAGILIISTAMGIRQTFGLFVHPVEAHQIATIGEISFALAIQNLTWGIAQPLAGGLSDRYGPGVVLGVAGTALYPNGVMLIGGFGILVGLGQAGMTFAVVISAVSKAATPARRAMAVAIAAAPFGFIISRRRTASQSLQTVPAAPSWRAIVDASREPGYLFLTTGFFACGFNLAFIGVHLPTYLSICHIGMNVSAMALATIGLCNVAGSYVFGSLVDRYPPQYLLVTLYATRAMAILAFAIFPPTILATMTFAVLMGLTWLGTVPLTNAVIMRFFGTGNLGVLFGVCFLSHQVGAFLGAWGGGLSYEFTGSYAPMWALEIMVSFGAALLNLPIRLPAQARA
jgi:MFS family permease